MKSGGDLHPARPDWWPPTKRPRATPGGLIAASVTYLSCREGGPPCLRTSPSLGGTLGVHQTSWRIPFPRHACMFLVLGFRGAWVSHAPLESQSSAGLRIQPYPRARDLVGPGYLHGTGCLSARAMDTGFPTVVWCLCLGLGFSVTPPLLAGVFLCVPGYGFWFRPTIPSWGFGCVRFGLGFGLRPAISG